MSLPINMMPGRPRPLDRRPSVTGTGEDSRASFDSLVAQQTQSPSVVAMPAASPPVYGGSLMHLHRATTYQAPEPAASEATEDTADVMESLVRDDDLEALRVSLVHQGATRRSVAGGSAVTPARSGYTTPGEQSVSLQSASSAPAGPPKSKKLLDQLLDMRSAVFGLLNAAITVPVMIAFCKVIFQHPDLHPFQDKLVRLVFLSAALHQLVFTLRSCVPGAVGQVQDVGLIFLSSMASMAAERGAENDRPVADTLATVLLMLSIATFLVGVMVIITARLKVASIVQYVPIPVVGGYLAFVGYFICVSGIQLATGVELKSAKSYLGLLSVDSLLRCLPMLCTWQVFHHTVHRFSSPAALPIALVSVVAAFYVVLLVSGWTLEDAQKGGWVPAPAESMDRFWEIWSLFEVQDWPGNIDWGAFPEQLPNLIALFIVVSFGSCMDIAAIQAEHPEELDFNNELELIGISNACCGITGLGYTGSYIFSQTLFNLRNGAKGPLVGGAIIIFEVSMCILPSSPVSFIPNFFFGGLMLWIGVDIMYDWLVACWGKVRKVEYVVIWITFGSVTRLGLEAGIVIGILASMAAFAYEYSKLSVTCFNVAASRSSFMRTYHQRYVLDQLSSNMVAISLSGYVFFGSATSVSEKAILIADLMLRDDDGPTADDSTSRHETEGMEARIALVRSVAPKTLLLDFRKVTGFDATAAQTFKVMRQRLEAKGVQLLIAHIPPDRIYIHKLLVANGVVGRQIISTGVVPQDEGEACLVFDTLNSGLHFCEEQLLEVAVQYNVCQAMVDDMPLSELLAANRSVYSISMPLLPDGVMRDLDTIAEEMKPFIETLEFLDAGSMVFSKGDLPRAIFIIQSGIISCEVDMTVTRTVGQESSLLLKAMISQPDRKVQSRTNAPPPEDVKVGSVNLVEYGPGGILGDMDYFLQRTRSFGAKVKVAPCKVLRISHENMQRMAAHAPSSLLVLQTIVLSGSSLSGAHALEALEMANL